MRRIACATVLVVSFALGGCKSSGNGAAFTITNETAGDNCPNGGKRIEATSSGGSTTIFACDGAISLNATAEAKGTNCPEGGVKLQTSDGFMYVCNGDAGDAGAPGAPGDAGPAGQDGQSVTVTAEDAGVNCLAGGFKLTSVSGTSYVCNGLDGVGGGDGGSGGTPVAVAPENPGTNCPAGGYKLVSPSGTNYVCNGAAGTPGQSVAVTAESPGTTCPAGGYKLTSAGGTSYVCNGAPGTPGQSVAVTSESQGTNCPTGGFKLVSAGGTSYVCNGAVGAPGQSVAVTVEYSGTNCPTGGYKLTSTSGTSYVCNGAQGPAGQSVAVTVEYPGTTCPAGGYKLVSASGTSYVCNGKDGQSISVTVEPSGLHCAAGGYRLDTATGSYYICNGKDGSSGGGGAGGGGGGGGGGSGGSLCEDKDNDGYYVGCASYGSIAGPDCDDNDANRYQWLTGYADQDGDGYTTGLAHTVCGGALLPPAYRGTATSTTDCNDADPDMWSQCGTCVDADKDGTYKSCDAWTRHKGPDCNDNDQLVSPLMPELPDDGKDNDCAGDGDFQANDGNGVFVSPSGADANAGTRAFPKKSLGAAATLASTSGSRRVYVAQGSYNDTVNMTTAVSFFGGYNGSWIRDPDGLGSVTAQMITIAGSTVPITQPIAIDGMTFPSAVVSSQAAVSVTRSRAIIISANYGISGTGYPFVAAGNSVTCSPGPTNACVPQTFFTGIAASGNSVLVGNFIQRTATSNTPAYGLQLSGSSTALVVGNTIDPGRTTSYNNDTYGILSVGGRLFLDRNTINTGESIYTTSPYGTSYGVYIGNPTVTTAVGNTIVGGAGTYTYAFYQNQGDLILANNVIVDGPSQKFWGLYVTNLGSTSGGTVHALSNVLHAGKSSLAYGVWMNAAGLDVSLMDNIIDLATSGAALHITPTSGRLYNNDVYAQPGTCLIETPLAMAYCMVDIDDVNACVAAGVCAESSANISVPPLFSSVATNDFHLLPSSLLINRGFDPVDGEGFSLVDRSHGPLGAISLYAASLAVRDIDGDTKPQGGRWDIGIDEWK